MKAYLLFPPGWTLATGSPHVALPLLGGFLRANGVECHERDLNIEIARSYIPSITEDVARDACLQGSLEAMNESYFAAEDQLILAAEKFNGSWNAQLGFMFSDSPQLSLDSAIEASSRQSPCTAYYTSNIVPDIINAAPTIVGFSIAAVGQLVPALELCRLLRLADYRGFIILGGNTISRLASELSRPRLFQIIDGLIPFQGELSLLELCRALTEGAPITRVPRLIWCDRETVRVNSSGARPDPNPNQVAPPDYRNFPLNDYWGSHYLNLVAARGCYYGRCNFCTIPYGWGNGGYSGVRTAELVLRDIEWLVTEHGVTKFKFVDEALSPAFMEEFSSMLLDSGLRIQWEGYTRLESSWASRDFVSLVSKAGFKKGYFGLELSSARRQLMEKRDQNCPRELARMCFEHGIKAHFFCMFGFPGTGREDAEETVSFLLENHQHIDTVDIFPWTYAKHTVVGGVQPIIDPGSELALEFSHRGLDQNMASDEVRELAQYYEELLWREKPRWLHPTYRLVSPWVEGE